MWGAGDTSREPSYQHDGGAALVGVSSVPEQPLFPQLSESGLMQLQPAVTAPAAVAHLAAPPPSPPSNAPSGPPSNHPSEPAEDDFAQATIGPAIAQIPYTYTPPPQFGVQATQPALGRASTSEAATAPLPGTANAVVPPTAPSTTGATVAITSVPSAGEAALPPTEVNVAQHTRALEAAEVEVAAPAQKKVGRFSVKKRQDTMGTSDNGSAQTGGGGTCLRCGFLVQQVDCSVPTWRPCSVHVLQQEASFFFSSCT